MSTSDFGADANYDEAKVGTYSLPDPLIFADGRRVATADDWRERRAEILRLFETHVFGSAPPTPGVTFALAAHDAEALGGAAIRRQVAVAVAPNAPKLNLLLYVPREVTAPAPVFLGPNFLGNHTVAADPGILLPKIVFAPDMDVTLPEGRATESSRGFQADRGPLAKIVGRGYAVATFYYGDLFPDRPGGKAESIQPAFEHAGAEYSWGALAVWAWAMSRALDALAQMPEIDAGRAALIGHSRHGKAALWAGALDERFRLFIANNSGKGGVSLMRRNFGETIRHLVTRYPHWFADAYRRYAGCEAELPVDQHMLIALIAPRPVYIASAADDLWADPKGEFLGALGADPVYRLLGTDGLAAREGPPLETPAMSTIGYHCRRGGHGVTDYDWDQFLRFADRHLRAAEPTKAHD
ncbi:MAG: hypothetical protein ACRED5_10445 [Propylenella sp.]